MITPITVKGLTIGAGKPKICVPVVETTESGIIEQFEKIKDSCAQIVEWRADFYEYVYDTGKVLKILKDIVHTLEEIPLIFTFRTREEGGEKDISKEDYEGLLKAVIVSRQADIVDVQLFQGGETVMNLIDAAHKEGVKIILSSHEFTYTPKKPEIVARLIKMQELGADILKIAVMPDSMKDVLVLLSAAEEMTSCHAKRPVAAISMSGCGLISRAAAESIGSCITFASMGKSSAPGQIKAEDLKTVLSILHKNFKKGNIFLIGFMGTGKTTISYELGRMTGMQEVDMDILIEEREHMRIAEIFELYGEEYFRKKETQALQAALKEEESIVSCGGGLVLRDENVRYMKENGTIVLLTASPQTIFERVRDSDSRPILNDNMNVSFIENLMEKRRGKYFQSADIVVETDHKNIEEVCREILKKLDQL